MSDSSEWQLTQAAMEPKQRGSATRRAIGRGCALALLIPAALIAWAAFNHFTALQPARSVAWSTDGKLLAAAFGGTPCTVICLLPDPDLDQVIRIWQTDHLDQPPTVLKGFASPVGPLAFSPDGRKLASGTGELPTRNALLWDMSNPSTPPIVLRAITPGSESLAFSPDGRWLAGTGGNGLGHNQIALWDMVNFSEYAAALPETQVDELTDVAWLPDGQTVVTGGSDGRARIWKATDPHAMPTILPDKGKPMFYIAVSRDGAQLAGVGQEKLDEPRLWDLHKPDSDPIVLQSPPEQIAALDFSLDGNRLAAAVRTNPDSDNPVLVWDLRHPGVKATFLRGHTRPVMDVAFSPDGHLLASAGLDGTVRIWDVEHPDSAPRVLHR